MRAIVTCALLITAACGARSPSPSSSAADSTGARTRMSQDRVWIDRDVPLLREERTRLEAALRSDRVTSAACHLGTCSVIDRDAGTEVQIDGQQAASLSAWLDAARSLPRAVRAPSNGPVPAPPPRGPCRDRESVERGQDSVTVASYGAWDDDPACTPIARTFATAADALLACREEPPVVVDVGLDGQLGSCEGPTCTCAAVSHVVFAPAKAARRLVLQYGIALKL